MTKKLFYLAFIGETASSVNTHGFAIKKHFEESGQILYEKAVKASFLNAGIYGASYTIADATSYLTENPYVSSGTFDQKMNQIHTKFRIALFVDEQKVYSNWRRIGHPILTPINFPGNVTNGTIPRRIKYPTGEYSVNSPNLAEAIKRQGNDSFLTKMWWDK